MVEVNERVTALARVPIFQDLPRGALEEIDRSAEELTLPAKSPVFNQGDPGTALYIIRSGKVRIFRRDEDGLEIDLSVLGPGESFGEMALLAGEPRSAHAEVLEEANLMVLPKEAFDRLLREFPNTAKAVFKEMRQWIIRDERRIEMEAKAAYKASRLSWFDFLVVLGTSVLLALIFNASNPNGIPLFPTFPDPCAFPAVSPATALEAIQSGEALLLDAMPENFFRKRHISGAVSMPLALFDIVYLMTFPEEDKERKIIVYGGTISRHYDLELAQKLILRGYKDVSILKGGLAEWEKMGYPVTERTPE